MSTTARDRQHNRKATAYTELFLIGTLAEIAILTSAAKASGTLVYRSAPVPMGGTDPRHRVYLRLLFTHP